MQEQSDEYISELSRIVQAHGGTPTADTSVAGDMYRTWMDIKTALSADDTKAVLQSCERGEDAALNAYKAVTGSPEQADGSVLDVLKRQQNGILSMHDRVKALRDMQ